MNITNVTNPGQSIKQNLKESIVFEAIKNNPEYVYGLIKPLTGSYSAELLSYMISRKWTAVDLENHLQQATVSPFRRSIDFIDIGITFDAGGDQEKCFIIEGGFDRFCYHFMPEDKSMDDCMLDYNQKELNVFCLSVTINWI